VTPSLGSSCGGT